MTPSHSLYVDIGNTTTVIWKERSKNIKKVWIASVVPHQNKKWKKLCQKNHWKCRFVQPSDIPLKSCYQGKIGVDRLLGIYAASYLTQKHGVVIDIGTAITVDFFHRKKGYLGGWIMAGPRLMAESLYEKTAQLPLVLSRVFPAGIGKNTHQSIAAGLSTVFHGIIKEAKEMALKLFHSKNYELFLTGGGAGHFHFPELKKEENLVLRGLKFLVEGKEHGRSSS